MIVQINRDQAQFSIHSVSNRWFCPPSSCLTLLPRANHRLYRTTGRTFLLTDHTPTTANTLPIVHRFP